MKRKVKELSLIDDSLRSDEGARVCNSCLWILFILILLININFISAGEKYTLKVTEEHPFFVVDNINDFNEETDIINVNGDIINVMQVGNGGAGESENKGKKNANGIWKTAKELQIGDSLLTDNGKKAKITSVKEIEEDVEVYNLESAIYNDYIVEGDVIVHNSDLGTEVPIEILKGIESSATVFVNSIGSKNSKAMQYNRIIWGMMQRVNGDFLKARDSASPGERIQLVKLMNEMLKYVTKNQIVLGSVNSDGTYPIPSSQNNEIGRFVKRVKETIGYDVVIDPVTPVSMVIPEKKLIIFSTMAFFGSDFYYYNALHEYGHANLHFRDAQGKVSSVKESTRLAFIDSGRQVNIYQGWKVDEITQGWINTLFNFAMIRKAHISACATELPYSIIFQEINARREMLKDGISASSNVNDMLSKINSRKIDNILAGLKQDTSAKYKHSILIDVAENQAIGLYLTVEGGVEKLIVIFFIESESKFIPNAKFQVTNKEVLEVMNKLFISESVIPNDPNEPINSFRILKPENIRALRIILNEYISSQNDYLRYSSQDTLVALESWNKEINTLLGVRDANERNRILCSMTNFIARHNLVRYGGLINQPTELQQWYDNPESVPRISELPK
jgi:hypothetical protein